jgi:hypothetical protein
MTSVDIRRRTIDQETAEWTAANQHLMVARFAQAKISLFDSGIRDLITRCPKYMDIPFPPDSCGWRLCILHEMRKQARESLTRALGPQPAHIFSEFFIEQQSDIILAEHIRREIKYMEEEMDENRLQLQMQTMNI